MECPSRPCRGTMEWVCCRDSKLQHAATTSHRSTVRTTYLHTHRRPGLLRPRTSSILSHRLQLTASHNSHQAYLTDSLSHHGIANPRTELLHRLQLTMEGMASSSSRRRRDSSLVDLTTNGVISRESEAVAFIEPSLAISHF